MPSRNPPQLDYASRSPKPRSHANDVRIHQTLYVVAVGVILLLLGLGYLAFRLYAFGLTP
jgi:hypothetical protein